MFELFSFRQLILVFILAAAAVWYAGIKLSKTVEVMDIRLGLGQALGGMIFLAIVTNLPEIAIIISASIMKNVPMAIGNILGGIAIQTLVLALLDAFVLKNQATLTYKASSSQALIEGLILIIILDIAIMGTQLPKSLIFFRLSPGDILILLTWLLGLWLVKNAHKNIPGKKKSVEATTSQNKIVRRARKEKRSTTIIISYFILFSLITFISGVALEESSRVIAMNLSWNGTIFGATILAAITALPEISTGYEAAKMEDFKLVISDIFGGNAFLPTLFILSTLITGQSTLPLAKHADIYLTCLGMLVTAIYILGLIFQSKKIFCWLGMDSIIVLCIYLFGIVGLFMMAR